jgi:hypothetical protein
MLRTFHDALLEYANSRWGRRIFVWSSVLIVLAAIVLSASLGIDRGTGSAAVSSRFATLVVMVVAVPALAVFNVALALIWATGRTVARLLRGS